MSEVNPARTIEDLQIATGLGRDSVIAAINAGQLPGAKVNGRYVVTAAAFDAYCLHGRWPIHVEPTPIRPADMIRSRKVS